MNNNGGITKENKLKFDNKAFYRTVFSMVIPMALQNLINVGVQSADVIMLGRVGEVVLSASSLAGQVQFVMMLIFFGLTSGATVLTAQYWGKGDVRTIEKVLAITLRLSMSVALVFALAAWFIPGALMRIFTPDPELIANGVRYLRLVAPGYLIVGFTNIYLMVMRSVEKVMLATIVFSISLVVNVIFNAVLIFGLLGFPAMGIGGAALATTLARVVELIIVIVYAVRNPILRLRKKDFLSRHKTLFKDFLRYAGPTILNEMLWGLAISTNSVIIGHLGAAAVAANSVSNVTRQLATVLSFGVAGAAGILTGKVLGAGDTQRAQVQARKLMRLALFTGLFGGCLILAIRPLVMHMMRLSDLANSYLGFQLLLMSVYVVCQAITATTVVGIFRGGGDTRFGLYMELCVMWGCSILWGALAAFVFHLPVQAVFAILMCDELIKLPLCLWRYSKRKWLRNVTRDAPEIQDEKTMLGGAGA